MLLTVCIRAEHGQALLDECVASVRGAADEIIVVEEPQPNDPDAVFARALGEAHGVWFLFLEGHERLCQQGDLRQEIGAATSEALSLTVRALRNSVGMAHRAVEPEHPLTHGFSTATDRRSVRLFRRRAGFAFGGRIDASVERALVGRGVVAHASRSAILALPIAAGTPWSFERRLAKGRRLVALHPREPTVWLDLGRCFLDAGVPAAARTCFLEAWRLRREPDAALYAAQALASEDRFEAALDALGTLTAGSFKPESEVREADVWELRGEMSRALERSDDAIAAYERALALDAALPIARLGLVERLCERGAVDLAEDHAGWLCAHYAGLPETWVAAALVHLARARPLSAIEALGVALDVDPASAPARYNLAIAYAQLGARRHAAVALEQAADTRGGIALAKLGRTNLRAPARTPDLSGMAPGGVVSFIALLAGGAGRVAVDVIRALHGRHPQALVVFDHGAFAGMALFDELAELDVRVVSIGSGAQLAAVLRQLDPAVMLCHSGPPLAGTPSVASRCVLVSISHGRAPLASSHHDWFVCLSADHRRCHPYLPEDRLEVIPNGVDLARFEGVPPDLRWWTDLPNVGGVRIVMLTRLDHSKFPRRLLHFVEPLHDLDVTITIAGQGTRRWEIEPDLARFRIGAKVRFVGTLASRAVPGFLAAADIGLHLTETDHETLSVSILEMLAAGLPIVAQPRGCLPDLVEEGVNGLLAEGEAAIAAALRRLVLSKAERLAMAAASRERARAYDLRRFDRAWRDLVARCVANRRRGDESPPPTPPVPPAKAAALIDRLSVRPAARKPRSFLVATTPRTGGSILCAALAATGVVGHPRDDLASWIHDLRGRSWRYDTLDDYLMARWNLGASPHGVYGCRLTIDHLATLCESAGTPEWPARWLDRIAPSLWVFLRRRDRTAQAVSLYRAETTGLWWDVGEPEIGVRPIDYDRAAIAACRERVERADAAWRALFEAFRIDPIEIWYEELVEDIEGHVRALLARLGIEPPAPFTCRTAMRIETDDRLAEWRDRYDGGA